MKNGKCPCEQFTDGVPLPDDFNIICVLWDKINNRCNYAYKKGKLY